MQEEDEELEVNRYDSKVLDGLKDSPVYKKQTEVRATIAQGGEVIFTELADGYKETKNTAKSGDAIVTNPGGEQYIIAADKFTKLYEPKNDQEGVFVAIGHCKAIENPWQEPISMLASWGEKQSGKADCMIADSYDVVTKTIAGEPYIIGKAEFLQTYKAVDIKPIEVKAPSITK